RQEHARWQGAARGDERPALSLRPDRSDDRAPAAARLPRRRRPAPAVRRGRRAGGGQPAARRLLAHLRHPGRLDLQPAGALRGRHAAQPCRPGAGQRGCRTAPVGHPRASRQAPAPRSPASPGRRHGVARRPTDVASLRRQGALTMQIHDLPEPVAQLARNVARAYGARPEVRAVALAGSQVSGFAGPESDLDLYLYQDRPLPLDARREIAMARAARAEVGNDFWEPGDEWIDAETGLH